VRHLKSLREFMDELESVGELQRIAVQVNLDLEIGAICRRCYETGAPAPLFENIKGIQQGFRVLGAPGGVSAQPGLYLARIALALGLPVKTSGRQIIDSLVEARGRKRVPPKIVSRGPVKRNVLKGDEVDLLRLPAPLLHEGDGGRYLNTMGVIVAQTPDKKWCNWSIARVMVLDKNRMAGIIAPNQHIGIIRQKWTDAGQDMPFALELGAEPFIPFVGGMPLPEYFDERDYVGAYSVETTKVFGIIIANRVNGCAHRYLSPDSSELRSFEIRMKFGPPTSCNRFLAANEKTLRQTFRLGNDRVATFTAIHAS
jgi:UbiD family decarboxylase